MSSRQQSHAILRSPKQKFAKFLHRLKARLYVKERARTEPRRYTRPADYLFLPAGVTLPGLQS